MNLMTLVPTVPDLIKYLLEGLAVAVVSAVILPGRLPSNYQRVATIAATAALTFYVLDKLAPQVAAGARQGAGWGTGQQLVGGAWDEQY